jgi:hypothetical protein
MNSSAAIRWIPRFVLLFPGVARKHGLSLEKIGGDTESLDILPPAA